VARAAEKAAKEGAKRADELRTYKSLMKVRLLLAVWRNQKGSRPSQSRACACCAVCLQSENMTSNAEMRNKYASVEEAEDDFM
jgi:hypothetical protein